MTMPRCEYRPSAPRERGVRAVVLLLRLAQRSQLNGLDAYRAADMRIDGVIHDTHRSATQLLDDAVPSDAVHPVFVIARRQARRLQSAGAITCG